MSKLQLTPEQTSNLLMLAEYLERPQLAKGFDMLEFENSCGTAGCAVGHGPAAGIPKMCSNWMEYSYKFLPQDRGRYNDEGYSLYWSFAFDSDWVKIDNTPLGAAKRIRWLLMGNEVPEQFDDFIGTRSEYARFEMEKWYVENITKLIF